MKNNENVRKDIVPPEKSAAIYARKSTLQESFSLRTQAELAKDKIRENNLVLYDIYEDEESATRYSPFHREGFKRLLCDAYSGRFKTIVVFRRDRLARKVEDLLEIRKIFRKLGIRVIYSSNGEFQPQEDNYISNFIESIIISVAELEPSMLAQRVKAGKEKKRENKLYDSAVPPFGFKINSDGNSKYKYIEDNDENCNKSEIIKDVYDMFLYPEEYEELNRIQIRNNTRNELLAKIALYINDKYSSILKSKKTSTNIANYLLNPVYAARMTKKANISTLKLLYENNLEVNKEEFIEAENVKPLIEEEKWFKSLVKFIREYEHSEPMKSDVDTYVFKKILYCKTCRCKIVLNKDIYQCKNKCTNLPKEKLEYSLLRRVVLGLLTHDYLLAAYVEDAKDMKDELNNLEGDLIKIQREQQDVIKDMLKSYDRDGKTNFEKLTSLINQEEQYKKSVDLNKNKERVIKKLLTSDMIKSMKDSDTISSAVMQLKKNIEYTNDLLNNIVNRIYVSGKNMEEFYDNCEEIKYKYS